MNTVTKRICSTFFMVSLLNACGGSGGNDDGTSSGGNQSGISYTGKETPAQIDNSNAEMIGKTSGEAVLQASTASVLPTGIEITEQVDLTPIHLSIIEASKSLALLPTGIDVSAEVCAGGGSANVSVPASSGRSVQEIVYDNCQFSFGNEGFKIDGKVILTYEDILDVDAGFSISYQNVTVSGFQANDETVTLNFTYSCTSLSDFNSCTSTSVFTGSDGDTHQVSDFNINGSSLYGYDGSASFSHNAYGNVSITVSSLTYGSCGGLPDGGSISFSSSNGSSGTIEFYGDCTVTGTWNSGTSSGTF